MPPRARARPAERSSSSATDSSRPEAACPRCHARRSGSTSGSVASANAPVHLLAVEHGRRLVDRRAHQGVTEPHLCTEFDQPGRLRRHRRVCSESEPARRPPQAAPRLPQARLPPSAAVSRVSSGSDSSCRRKLCSIRFASGATLGSSNPPASSAGVRPRGSSRSASGFPRASAMTRSRTCSSRRPGHAESSSARASMSLSPPSSSSGSPASSRTSLGLTHREHQPDRLGQEPPCNERDGQH